MISKYDIKLQKMWMCVCLIRSYYETDPTGGCLHIVLDDGNYDINSVRFVSNYSYENNDIWGITIAQMLLEFNENELEQICERSWEIEDKIERTPLNY